MVFSDRLLRTLKYEFQEIEVLRLRELQELEALNDRLRLATRLIIFDEASMGSFLWSGRTLDPVYNKVDKVLAYTSPEVARDLDGKAQQSKGDVQLRFLPMKAPLDAWMAALRLLILGEAFVPAELLADAATSPETAPEPVANPAPARTEMRDPFRHQANLTDREAQVLRLVADGLPNKSVAHQLNLSEHTVKLHVHHIYSKIGVRNRAGATSWFLSRMQQPEIREKDKA